MVLEEDAIDPLQRRLQSGNLFHDVRAIALVVDHPEDAFEVAAYSLEPVEGRLLVLLLHGEWMVTPHRGWDGVVSRKGETPEEGVRGLWLAPSFVEGA